MSWQNAYMTKSHVDNYNIFYSLTQTLWTQLIENPPVYLWCTVICSPYYLVSGFECILKCSCPAFKHVNVFYMWGMILTVPLELLLNYWGSTCTFCLFCQINLLTLLISICRYLFLLHEKCLWKSILWYNTFVKLFWRTELK